jgi:ABC-type multidrug transport system ATPase subunit
VLLLEGVIAEAGTRRVLDGLDLAVPRGDCFGVVSTDPDTRRALIGLLAGRRAPTAGRVRIDGLDPVRDAEVLTGRVVVDTTASSAQPSDEGGADVWLVLDEGEAALAAADERAARAARLRRVCRGPHRTVLLATDDRPSAEAVCDRVAVLVRGRLSAPAPDAPHGRAAAVHTPCRALVRIPTPQAHHHLEGGTS